MIVIATGTYRILRGTTVDGFLDEIDNSTGVASGVTASIIEVGTRITTGADDRPQTVRLWRGRFPAGTDIRSDDRVQSEQTGFTWAIDSVSDADVVVHHGETRVDLRSIL